MEIKVGLLVGHYGKGTGATKGECDEWKLAAADAHELARQLNRDGLLQPVVISIDRVAHPWDLVQKISRISPPSFLGGAGNIDARVEWAIRDRIQLAVELHLNRSILNDAGLIRAAGHEVYICRRPGPRTRRLGEILREEMALHLGNRARGLKKRNFRILRKLHAANIPAALLEPAFLTEDRTVSREWRGRYVGALKGALYRYFNLGG
jgi:N-acetylmuramoyl-L-alanine amidase